MIHHKRFELLKFEKQTLLVCLLLNLTIFITEITFSFIANSSAMVGDAIDSLGDTITYCIALYAIYKLKGEKEDKTIWLGIVQICLAAVLLAILIQNTVNYSKNDVNNIYLFVFAGASLVSNCVCAILLLISRKKQDADVNVKATFIFSSIDIYQNTLTIIAGIIMMYVPQSKNFPDLAVGCVFFLAILISALVLFEHHFKEFKSKVVSKSSI